MLLLLLLLPLIVAAAAADAAGVIYNLNRSERVKHLSSVLQNWVLVYFLSNELAHWRLCAYVCEYGYGYS